jgi:quercetin dioxygenase-like cupin family protein
MSLRSRILLAALPITALAGVLIGQQTASQRFPQFENDDVKVWRSVIVPGAPVTPHHHDHARIIVAMTGGKIDLAEQNGPTEHQLWETGKAYWLPKNAPGTMHTDVNVGTEPVVVMVIEMKKN